MNKKPLVLVIDDDPQIIQMTPFFLAKWGFESLTASNTESGLNLVGNLPDADLVITDWEMPGEGGGAIVRLSKKIAPARPVIVASGAIAGDMIKMIRASGADEFLPKPYTGADLKAVIERLLKPTVPAPVKPVTLEDFLDFQRENEPSPGPEWFSWAEWVDKIESAVKEECGHTPSKPVPIETLLGTKSAGLFRELKSLVALRMPAL